jgi:LDH2 family malate/lactate/ureidoglycolate dehydrogenase
MRFTINEARQLVEASMTATGHTTEESTIIADHLIDCELRGLAYGGLSRAISVVDRIHRTTTPRRPMTVLQETPFSASLDGGDNVGYLVGARCTDIALEKASQTGMAMIGASKTWFTGMYSYYLERIVAKGFVGMIAGSGTQLVAPHGGTEGRYGTNPIAFGFPSITTPVIWDIGTSNVMIGEVALKARLGEQLPAGQAFDAEGRPTCDPTAALCGAFAVWGGHKGSGLAMMIQMLAMMTGQVIAPGPQRDSGLFILAVNPSLFSTGEDFPARVAEYAQSIRDTRPLDPARPVRVPFDRSITERNERLALDAIDVPDKVVQALRDIIAQGRNSA